MAQNGRIDAKCFRCGIDIDVDPSGYKRAIKKNPDTPHVYCKDCLKIVKTERLNNVSKEEKQARFKKSMEARALMTDEQKQEISRKLSEAHKRNWENKTEEEKIEFFKARKISDEGRKRISEFQKKKFENEEERIKLGQAIKKTYDSKSDEEKEVLRQQKKDWYNNQSDEYKEAHRQHSIDYWNNRTEEEMEQYSQWKRDWWKNMSDEYRESFIQLRRDQFANLPDDKKEEIRDRLRNYYNNLSEEEKIEHNRIGGLSWENMSEEDKENKIKLLTRVAKEYWDNLSEDKLNEIRIKRKLTSKQWWDSLSDEEKINHHKKQLISAGNSNNQLHLKFENKIKKELNNIYYEKEYHSINNGIIHSWDYVIYDDKIDILIDLDGKYYHADSRNEYNYIHSIEEYDVMRFQSIPDNVKYCIIYEKEFDKSFNEFIKVLNMTYEEFINYQFKLFKILPFPYPKYNINDLCFSISSLIKMDCENKYHNKLINTRIGDHFIQHFHESIYHYKYKEYSPLEVIKNDKLLMNFIKENKAYINPYNMNKVLQSFNIANKYQNIQLLSPGIYKLIIHKYLNEYNTIFNPNNQFDEILLAVISLNKKYIGLSDTEIHYSESLELLKTLYNIIPSTKDDIILKYDSNIIDNYDCILTHLISDKYIDEILDKYKCNKYLFIVDEVSKYSDNIIDKIENKLYQKYLIMI